MGGVIGQEILPVLEFLDTRHIESGGRACLRIKGECHARKHTGYQDARSVADFGCAAARRNRDACRRHDIDLHHAILRRRQNAQRIRLNHVISGFLHHASALFQDSAITEDLGPGIRGKRNLDAGQLDHRARRRRFDQVAVEHRAVLPDRGTIHPEFSGRLDKPNRSRRSHGHEYQAGESRQKKCNFRHLGLQWIRLSTKIYLKMSKRKQGQLRDSVGQASVARLAGSFRSVS